uniref:Dolichyldiphosphatase 1 n=1 Tax=Salvator merianae TaxID=96440 RepID=A0A8D0E7M3_SALMN
MAAVGECSVAVPLKPISLTHVEYPAGDFTGYFLAYMSLGPIFIIFGFITLIVFKRELHTTEAKRSSRVREAAAGTAEPFCTVLTTPFRQPLRSRHSKISGVNSTARELAVGLLQNCGKPVRSLSWWACCSTKV